ncbi:MAG: FG-GAP-like repeat-containing protein [Spirochaetota bacterium]
MKIKLYLVSFAFLLTLISCDSDMVQDGVDSSQDARVPDINIKLISDSIPSGGSTAEITGVHAGTSKDVVFTIENRGSEDLMLTGYPIVAVSGQDADAFPQGGITQPFSVIAGGTSEPFTVVFAPADAETKSAIITIESNDPDEPVYEFTITGRSTPIPDFTARLRKAVISLTVHFENKSGGEITSYEWDFNGDGITDSTEQSPYCTYSKTGEYSVVLTTTGPGGTNLNVKTNYIRVFPPEKTIIAENINGNLHDISIYSADVNGDGYNDIVYSAFNSQSDEADIICAVNPGNNIHSSAWTYNIIDSDFNKASSVFVADINKDTYPDIIATAYNSSSDNPALPEIVWWMNDGYGSFTRMPAIESAFNYATSVTVADINNDGSIDIIATASSGTGLGEIAWWKNNGSGSFTRMNPIDEHFAGASYVTTAYINNDAYPEILAAGRTPGEGSASWWLNDTNEGFIKQELDQADDLSQSIGVADINNDGYMDIYAACKGHALSWWANNGSGVMGNMQTVGNDSLYNIYHSVKAFNADNDGDIDLAATKSSTGDLIWWENNGTGIFTVKHEIDTDLTGAAFLFSADLDKDGNPEIICAGKDSIASYNFRSDIWYKHQLSENMTSINSIYTYDINNDGDPDIFGASKNYNNLIYWENPYAQANTNWTERIINTTDFTNASYIHVSDLDNDNIPDIFGAVYSGTIANGGLAWWKNNGNNNFTGGYTIDNLRYISAITTCDTDADGDKDIFASMASSTSGDPKIAWWENQGNGSVSAINVVDYDFNYANNIMLVDLDNDQKPDILASASYVNYAADDIAWWRNEGNGNFSSRNRIANDFNRLTSLQAADMDNDGDIDVICSSTLLSNDYIAWWENPAVGSNGSWIKHTVDSTLSNIQSIYAADINFDNKVDIAAVRGGGDNNDLDVAWFKNNGNDTFTRYTIDTGFNGSTAVYLTDVDGDGDPDIIGSSASDGVVWWENNITNWGT